MKEYHKIHSLYKREEKGALIIGEFSLPEFEYLKENVWVFSEKVDGTSIRIVWDGTQVTFGGKTDNASLPAMLVTALQHLFLSQVDKFSSSFPDGACLYGEGYGAKIQSGGKYRQDQGFVLFDVKIGEWWLKREDVEDIAGQFSLDVVPVIGRGTLGDLVDLTQSGFTSRWGDFQAEGIVARPQVELFTRSGERIITKLKTKDFARVTKKD